jgi:hypothetical protein
MAVISGAMRMLLESSLVNVEVEFAVAPFSGATGSLVSRADGSPSRGPHAERCVVQLGAGDHPWFEIECAVGVLQAGIFST